jgi:hypothetical protein
MKPASFPHFLSSRSKRRKAQNAWEKRTVALSVPAFNT